MLLSSPLLEPPREAVMAGREGTVVVECIVTKQGEPVDCTLEQDLPGGLGQAVLEMVERQRYRPALQDGKPLAVLITIPIFVRHPEPPPDLESSPGVGKQTDRLPKVRMGATTVSGRLGPEHIQRAVRFNFGRLRRCYEQGLARNPNLRGRLVVRFMIDERGFSRSVAIEESDIPDATLSECVRRAFSGLEFPRPQSGVVRVLYPITVDPG